MSADRVIDLLALGALACVGVTGLARAVALRSRGVWVLPIDRKRRLPEALVDLAFVLALLAFVGESVAVAALPEWHPAFALLREPGLAGLRWLGILVAVAGVALYVRALRDFGLSWRFTIDRERPGELVTEGVFARTRNPVYLALALLAAGVALALGDALLIAIACAAPLYFQFLIRREERFLSAHYGESYASYCARVPRWLGRTRPRAGSRGR